MARDEQDAPAKQANNRRLPPEHSRFKSGISGNPSGRPKLAATFGQYIRDFLDAKDPNAKPGQEAKTRLESLVIRLYKEDAKTLLAYGFGKPVEMVELHGAEGGVVEFKVCLSNEEMPR